MMNDERLATTLELDETASRAFRNVHLQEKSVMMVSERLL